MKDGEIPTKLSEIKINSEGALAKKGDTGHYYCGRSVLSCPCCDGNCGPNNGCNCPACQRLDQEEREQKEEDDRSPCAEPMMECWSWGEQPSVDELRETLQALIYEQRELASIAAGTTLSAMRLQQRITVLGRYFIALSRYKPSIPKSLKLKELGKEMKTQPRKRRNRRADHSEEASLGLARIGARAALSFAFAFLRRAWRSGEDADLCRELLDEALEALQDLPEATLFDDQSVSPVWLEVVERATKFLRSVIAG